MRGYFGIGIQNTKNEMNVGTLWRSASVMGAAFIFTIGRRYKNQASDTGKAFRYIPLYNFETFDQFFKALPHSCMLVGLEQRAGCISSTEFKHPERCIYLLGVEDSGLTNEAIANCHQLVQLPGEQSLNVAVAGSIIMYDRILTIMNKKRV